MTAERICRKCGTSRPATSEFFPASARCRDGLEWTCRACGRERTRAWAAANRERKRESDRLYRAENAEHVQEVQRKYRQEHREECTERKRLWRIAHPEASKEQRRRWYYAHSHYANATAVAWAASHPDETKAATDKWREAHPEAVRAMHHRRRARKAKATGTHTADDILAQYERQSGACYWCDAEVGQDYHVDHVVPLSKGGSDGPDNLVIACPTCNLRKGAKMPDEFVKDLAVAQVAAA